MKGIYTMKINMDWVTSQGLLHKFTLTNLIFLMLFVNWAVAESNIYYVSSATGSNTNGDGAQNNPWASISYAISHINLPNEETAKIYIAGGIYIENIEIRKNISLYGSFDYNTWEQNYESIKTVIKGNLQSVIRIYGESYGGPTTSIILDGLDITGGRARTASPSDPFPYPWTGYGGGIHTFSDVTIRNCKIYENTAGNAGGGIACFDNTKIENCQLYENHCYTGSAIYLCQNDAVITSCDIYDNTPSGITVFSEFGKDLIIKDSWIHNNSQSLGISTNNGNVELLNTYIESTNSATSLSNASSVLINGCIFRNNGSAVKVRQQSGTTNITNCLIAGNDRMSNGGIIDLSNTKSEIFHCTITENKVLDGYGIIEIYSDEFKFVNSIIWNEGDDLKLLKTTHPPILVNCCIQDSDEGTNIIYDNPLFVDPMIGDYHLQSNSPCIDSGTLLEDINIDLDGNLRLYGTSYDIGCYEYDPNYRIPTPTITPSYTASQSKTPTVSPTPICCKGDTDCSDGSITPGDALLAFKFYLGSATPATTPCDQACAADWDNNGNITPADALCIFREYLLMPC